MRHCTLSVVGSSFHHWGCEGLRFRYGFEGGETLKAADDLSGQERESGKK